MGRRFGHDGCSAGGLYRTDNPAAQLDECDSAMLSSPYSHGTSFRGDAGSSRLFGYFAEADARRCITLQSDILGAFSFSLRWAGWKSDGPLTFSRRDTYYLGFTLAKNIKSVYINGG